MKRLLIVSIAATLCFGVVEPVAAQGWNPPSDAQRCPSKWGAGDTRGSANHVKPATVLAAMQLVKTGQIIELGRVLEGTMPVFGTRRSTSTPSARSSTRGATAAAATRKS